ncbi:hypothetical protein LTR53_013898 [Teratosphaeriaceae sp. CCFEE 6253]|nr:hypothetical protein LTR53_013898 [Teratosphaeriaceae sp. CCFEE 6253]
MHKEVQRMKGNAKYRTAGDQQWAVKKVMNTRTERQRDTPSAGHMTPVKKLTRPDAGRRILGVTTRDPGDETRYGPEVWVWPHFPWNDLSTRALWAEVYRSIGAVSDLSRAEVRLNGWLAYVWTDPLDMANSETYRISDDDSFGRAISLHDTIKFRHNVRAMFHVEYIDGAPADSTQAPFPELPGYPA